MISKRWIEETGGDDELARAVLRSGLDADPPASAESAVWQSLSLAIAVPPVTGGPGGAPSPSGSAGSGAAAALKGASTLATLSKGFALGVGVSLVVAAAGRLELTPVQRATTVVPPSGEATVGTRLQPPPAPVNPVPDLPKPDLEALSREGVGIGVAAHPSAHAASGSAGVAPSEPTLPVPHVAGTSSVGAFPITEDGRSPKSRLEEEAAMLRSARSELQGGRLAEAFATLEASREKFSAPELSQEREALVIELLYRSGQRASAAAKAESFLARFPDSPHRAKVRSFAAPR